MFNFLLKSCCFSGYKINRLPCVTYLKNRVTFMLSSSCFLAVTMENLLRFHFFRQTVWLIIFTPCQYIIVKSAELDSLSLNYSINTGAVNTGKLRLYANLIVHFVARILVRHTNCVNISVYIQERNHSPVTFVTSTLHKMKISR